MWQEARRQERKIRGLLVDYRKRADRKKDYYERIKLGLTQFLQIHGLQCKIHLDHNTSFSVENSMLVPWNEQNDNLIDRFDVRAHLDSIPVVQTEDEDILDQEERVLNYERYRIIAQNSFLGTPEEKYLKQLNLEEQFGFTDNKSKKGGATIGYNYEDSDGIKDINPSEEVIEEPEEDCSDSEFDVDLCINVSKMDPIQANEMNKHGCKFGMSSNDFYSFLINDVEEAEALKLAREEEEEKLLYAGRKSRKARRFYREKILANTSISSPSYAAKISPEKTSFRADTSKSRSVSPSPDNCGEITYITSFGGEEQNPSTSKAADEVKTSIKQAGSNRRSRSPEKVDSKDRRRCRFQRSSSNSRSGYNKSEFYYAIKSKSKLSISTYRRLRSSSKNRYRRGSRSRSSSSSVSRSSERCRSRKRKNYRQFRENRFSSFSSSSSRNSSGPDKENATSSTNNNKVSSGTTPIGIPRYYGRRKDNRSSSSDSTTLTEHNNKNSNRETSTKITPNKVIDRLKKKRQALLNRQFKADKRAAQLKRERDILEQRIREDELRDISIRVRKRHREMRRANESESSSYSDSSFTSRSESTKSTSRGKRDKEISKHSKKSDCPADSRRVKEDRTNNYRRSESRTGKVGIEKGFL